MVLRALSVAVILVNLALLAVVHPARETARRYALAAKQRELRSLSIENRGLLLGLAEARRPERMAARAGAFGLDLRAVEHGNVDRRGDRPSSSAAPGRAGTVVQANRR
jgi:hypothetical protein